MNEFLNENGRSSLVFLNNEPTSNEASNRSTPSLTYYSSNLGARLIKYKVEIIMDTEILFSRKGLFLYFFRNSTSIPITTANISEVTSIIATIKIKKN